MWLGSMGLKQYAAGQRMAAMAHGHTETHATRGDHARVVTREACDYVL